MIRPLEQAHAAPSNGDDGASAGATDRCRTATEATQLRVSTSVQRAPRGDRRCRAAYEFALADDQDAAEARPKLREIQAGLPTAIRAAHNGPYLVTNAERLLSWLAYRTRRLHRWRSAAAAPRSSSLTATGATTRSASRTRRIRTALPIGATPTLVSRSRSSTTEAPARIRASARTGCDRVPA